MDFGEKFYNEYFDETIDEDQRKFICTLKNYKIPKLFKYTNLNHINDLLWEDLMFLPPINLLNDPNEAVINYNFSKVIHNILNPIKDIELTNINELQNQIQTEFSALLDTINIDSINDGDIQISEQNEVFSSSDSFDKYIHSSIQNITKFLKGYYFVLAFSCKNNSPPLWHHYADGHRGVCIEYDITNCNKAFLRNNCFPVFYDDSDFSKDINSIRVLKEKFLLKPLLKKGTDWNYEQEWRIVLNQDQLLNKIGDYYCGYDDKQYIKFLKPKTVFMGKDISKDDEIKIKGVCQCRNIQLFKMEQDFSQYKLTPKKIELGDFK